MITQEEYEEAQEIVWNYENQLKKQGKAFDTSKETALNIDLVSGCFPTDKEIEEAADKELNNTYGTDWSDLEGIFINAVKWVKEYQANNR